jgi:hypothetical protein
LDEQNGCGFFQVQHLIGRPPNESAPAWQEMQQEGLVVGWFFEEELMKKSARHGDFTSK